MRPITSSTFLSPTTEPHPSWVALLRALFVFRAQLNDHPPKLDETPATIEKVARGIILVINHERQLFEIRFEDGAILSTTLEELLFRDDEGEERISVPVEVCAPPDDLLALHKALERSWRFLRLEFLHAAQAGLCSIFACPGSPLAPFVLVAYDAFRHFDVVDWQAGIAQAPTGERLFSIHVGLLRDPAAPFEAHQSPQKVEQRRRRGSPDRDGLKQLLDELYPGGIPDQTSLKNKDLFSAVIKAREDSGLEPPHPSETTILRAAGRRGK